LNAVSPATGFATKGGMSMPLSSMASNLKQSEGVVDGLDYVTSSGVERVGVGFDGCKQGVLSYEYVVTAATRAFDISVTWDNYSKRDTTTFSSSNNSVLSLCLNDFKKSGKLPFTIGLDWYSFDKDGYSGMSNIIISCNGTVAVLNNNGSLPPKVYDASVKVV
jgi:hypothetical protein